jgi:hypothetical protein
MLKNLIRGVVHTGKLIAGLLLYVASKKTLAFSYQSMVYLFCLTKGRSNDYLSFLIGILKPGYKFGKTADGILGAMSGNEREIVISDLRNQGYHVFDKRLSDDLCDRLLEFAVSNPCISRPMDGESKEKKKRVVYPRDKPETVRYDFTTQDLLENKDVQQLLADMSFPALAQEYLGARPVMDVVSMWWHTAYSEKPDMDAAQYFHFDMDRPKWLKFFIYLTDVTADSGAHTFIAGSQQTGGIPSSMLKKGYVRLSDEEVESHYGRDKVIEFVAPRGTVIAEDTRGLHKGKHVKHGDRLILQIQFSNSLFGAYYSKANIGNDVTEYLKNRMQKFPDLYSAYR